MFKSLRWKLAFMAVKLVLATVIPLLFTTTWMVNKMVKEKHEEQVTQETTTIVRLIEEYYNGFRQNIKMFSHSRLLQSVDDSVRQYITARNEKMDSSTRGGIQQHIYEKFEEFGKTHKGISFTFFGTRHGGFIGYPENTRNTYDPRKRNWYQQAVANQDQVIQTAPYINKTTSTLGISLAQAVPGTAGNIAGVVAVTISNDFLEQTIRKVKIGQTGYVVLLHKSGIVLADGRNPDNNMKKLPETDFASGMNSKNILKGEKAEYSVDIGNIRYNVHSISSRDNDWIIMTFMDQEELHAASVSVRNRLLGIAALVMLMVCLFSFFAASRLLKPINSIMQDLAAFEGDLTMRFKVQSKDEIGELAKWFNVFLEKLQKLLCGVQEETENVNSSAGGLSGIASTLLENAKGTSSRANTVAAATEEMNANINNVAAAMEQSATNISMVASAAEEMTANINDIAGSVRSAAEISRNGVAQAQQTSSRMGELDEAAQAISEVTNTITEISEQTNLLALNATIEAARAGEAGKGFAVVANEIKELARQTAEATDNIRDKINGVQQTSNTSIRAINDIVGIINKINEIITKVTDAIDQQSTTTREIAENINHASLGLNEVNENVNQSSVVSASISKEIAEVNTASRELVAHGEKLNSHSENLRTLADSLQKLVGVFRI